MLKNLLLSNFENIPKLWQRRVFFCKMTTLFAFFGWIGSHTISGANISLPKWSLTLATNLGCIVYIFNRLKARATRSKVKAVFETYCTYSPVVIEIFHVYFYTALSWALQSWGLLQCHRLILLKFRPCINRSAKIPISKFKLPAINHGWTRINHIGAFSMQKASWSLDILLLLTT